MKFFILKTALKKNCIGVKIVLDSSYYNKPARSLYSLEIELELKNLIPVFLDTDNLRLTKLQKDVSIDLLRRLLVVLGFAWK